MTKVVTVGDVCFRLICYWFTLVDVEEGTLDKFVVVDTDLFQFVITFY